MLTSLINYHSIHLSVTCCSLYTMCTCNWGWSELNLFQKHELNNMFNRIINLLSFSHIIFPISNIKRMYERKLFHFTSSSRVNFHNILKFSILLFHKDMRNIFHKIKDTPLQMLHNTINIFNYYFVHHCPVNFG